MLFKNIRIQLKLSKFSKKGSRRYGLIRIWKMIPGIKQLTHSHVELENSLEITYTTFLILQLRL